MPCHTEKPAPSTKVHSEAMKAQKYVSRPKPNGCQSSAGRSPRLSAMNSSTSVIVSARECAASDSIADEWLISPPTSLAIAMPRFATPATTTVPVLSPPEPCSGLPTSPWAAGTGGPGVAAESSAVTRGWLMAPGCPAVATSNPLRSPHPDEVHHEDE